MSENSTALADAMQPGSVDSRQPALTAQRDLCNEVHTGRYRSSAQGFLNDAMPALPLCGMRERRGEASRQRGGEGDREQRFRATYQFRFIQPYLKF